MIQRLAIIGVGLIGGSLGLRLKRDGLATEIVGCGRGRDNLETAQARGCIDRWTHDPADAVTGADLVVLGVPVAGMADVFKRIGPALAPEAVVTDVGSVKAGVLAAAASLPRPERFVGGHPIAGTENSGAAAADADLFNDRRWVLTPMASTDPGAVKMIADVARGVGAFVDEMTPERHDEIFAWVSHLPHVIAFALADALNANDSNLFRYGGGGLREFLRIAASDPVMWRDIFAANAVALRAAAGDFAKRMESLARDFDDPQAMQATLERIRAAVRAGRG